MNGFLVGVVVVATFVAVPVLAYNAGRVLTWFERKVMKK